MPSLIESLPGISLPVADVTDALSKMWHVDFVEGQEAPSEFRASQMNLVLHFGLDTSKEEALERFDTAMSFGERHPCRIIVLCPDIEETSGDELLEGKLFSQCYIGPHRGDRFCCEALMLSYPRTEPGFLKNQISIWLEGGLPTCYWSNRVPAQRINDYYLTFLKTCRKVIYDSAVEGDAYEAVNWPNPQAVCDLAHARTLPMRQLLGQFYSAFHPSVLVEGLKEVTIRYSADKFSEAKNLLEWSRSCLEECERCCDAKLEVSRFATEPIEGNEETSLEIEWTFEGKKHFQWSARKSFPLSTLRADFGSGGNDRIMHIKHVTAVEALAEALFS